MLAVGNRRASHGARQIADRTKRRLGGVDAPGIVTLSRSLIVPFLTFSERRDLREQAYRAWTTRGEHDGKHDNRPIACEILAAALLWIATLMMLVSLSSHGFRRATTVAAAGLILGLLLYAVGFVAIGGEWFAMWQSQIWNGQQKAFDFIGMIGIVLVVVLLPEDRSAIE